MRQRNDRRQLQGCHEVSSRGTTWQPRSLSRFCQPISRDLPGSEGLFSSFVTALPPGKGRPRDSSPPSLMWESHTLGRGRGTISNFIRILTRVPFARFFGRVSARAGRMKICIAVGRTRRLGGAPLPPHPPPPPFYLVMPFIISCSVSPPFLHFSLGRPRPSLSSFSVSRACVYLSVPRCRPCFEWGGNNTGAKGERWTIAKKKRITVTRGKGRRTGAGHMDLLHCVQQHIIEADL